jgi:hypothetical protein
MTRSKTHTNAPHSRSRLGRRLGAAAATAAIALLALPAVGQAHGKYGYYKFGAELNPTVQPSNSVPSHPCEPVAGQACTRVSMEAYGRPDGGERAKRNGVIKRIRVIAGEGGSFRPLLARANPNTQRAKLSRYGPKIDYEGQDQANWDSDHYKVEAFKVHIPVRRGEHLGALGRYTSMVRCSSGGPNQLLFQPRLLKSPVQEADDTDGCWLLMEAVVKYRRR